MNMKKYKIASICYYIAAVASYVASIVFLTSNDSNNRGVIWLCIGSAMLCLGSAFLMKSNKKDKKDKTLEQ